MVRHCAVIGCNSDSRYLPPVRFFKFPGPMKKGHLRKQWIKNVNRRRDDNTFWNPKPEDVVCQKHFVEDRPTVKYPVPQLNMGHGFVTEVKGRAVIKKHHSLPATKSGVRKSAAPADNTTQNSATSSISNSKSYIHYFAGIVSENILDFKIIMSVI